MTNEKSDFLSPSNQIIIIKKMIKEVVEAVIQVYTYLYYFKFYSGDY